MSRSLRSFLAVAGLAVSLVTAACGGDDGDDRVVSDLSDDELEEVCRDAADEELSEGDERALAEIFCTIQASQGGQCSDSAVSSCVDQFVNAPDEEPDPNAPCEVGFDTTNCGATVDEINTCNDAQLDQLVDLAGELNCANAAEVLNQNPALPSACNVVMEKCPAFFEDDNG